MNAIQRAAFELRLDDLERMVASPSDLTGAMLSACSAHDPDPGMQLRVVRFLVEKGASVEERDKNGVTPLHRAVRFRSPAAVKELIALGADPNAADRRTGSTPLHRAVTGTGAPATAGKLDAVIEIIRTLLAHGADPARKNKSGKTPLHYVRNPRVRAAFAENTRIQ